MTKKRFFTLNQWVLIALLVVGSCNIYAKPAEGKCHRHPMRAITKELHSNGTLTDDDISHIKQYIKSADAFYNRIDHMVSSNIITIEQGESFKKAYQESYNQQ